MIQVFLVVHRFKTNEDTMKVIGVFSSIDRAKSIVDQYQKNLTGFCDHPEGFQIIPFNLSKNKIDYPSKVFLLMSWKKDGDSESDITFDGVFASRIPSVLAKIKKAIADPSHNNTVAVYRINHSEWKEGFYRE